MQSERATREGEAGHTDGRKGVRREQLPKRPYSSLQRIAESFA